MVDLEQVLVDAVEGGRRATIVPPVGALHRRARRRRARIAVLLTVVPVLAVAGGYGALQAHSSPRHLIEPAAAKGWTPVVPGASSPSPFGPGMQNRSAHPEVCEAGVPDGRLQRPVSFGRENVLEPPGAASSSLTPRKVAERFRATQWPLPGGRTVIVFGLLSAPTPARILPDGSTRPDYVGTPAWLVAQCYVSDDLVRGHSQPYRRHTGMTSPSPLPDFFSGVQYTLLTASGGPGAFVERTGLDTPARKAVRFVTVPWQRNGRDSPDGRRIGISYPAAEPCATFDRLDVSPGTDVVRVQVRLRILPESPKTCPGTTTHDAVVGLLEPLGNRRLIDARREPVELISGRPAVSPLH